MKNITLRLLLLLVTITGSSITTYSQTNVSGFINANTTWDLTGSPYIVTGNALLSHNYTLTIQPGVVVKFNDSTALQIDGELIAIGTPGNHITFTSNKANPAPGDWGKIHFADTCVDAVHDQFGNYVSGSIMKYCDVLYGGEIGYGQIHIETSSPYFTHCNFSYSLKCGVYLNQSYSLLDSSIFQNCIESGLRYESLSPTLAKDIIVKNDSFVNNYHGGVYFNTVNVMQGNYIKIQNCYFTQNDVFGPITLGGGNNIIIEENHFNNNTANTGSAINTSGMYENCTISCNHFENNHFGYGVLFSQTQASRISIYDNLIENNTAVASLPFNPGTSVFYMVCDTADIYNNIIRNNSAPGSTTCMFIPALNTNQTLNVNNNHFFNNSGDKLIYFNGQNISSGNNNIMYLKHNNLYNPQVTYEVYNDIPYGSANLYLDSNFWGPANFQHIDSVIYDYFDNAGKSVVYYSPTLPQPVRVDITCQSFIVNDVEENSISDNFNIYPNPASNSLMIECVNQLKNSCVEIFSYSGSRVLFENIMDTRLSISLQNFSSGIYYVRLFDGNNYSVMKLIVQH